jgi:hypothetical protein
MEAKPGGPLTATRRPEEADMDRMRIDRDDATPALDRAWAATRPPELSAEAFDRIWAEVQRRFDDRPASLPMARTAPGRPRRALALVAVGLAQLAAAALLVTWVLNRPGVAPGPGGQVVRVDPPAHRPVVVARHDVETDEMLIIELGDGRAIEERRSAPESVPSLAMLDLPESTPSDMLGHLEALSR